jgi:hypothetical protein
MVKRKGPLFGRFARSRFSQAKIGDGALEHRNRYCHRIEMQRALERHIARSERLIPAILRPVDWRGAPFDRTGITEKVEGYITPQREALNSRRQD